MKKPFDYLCGKNPSIGDYHRALELGLREQELRTQEGKRRAEQSKINLEAITKKTIENLRNTGASEEQIAQIEKTIYGSKKE